MSSIPPGGMGGFFSGMFGDLMKMMKSDSPLPWELTVQLALNVAGGDANGGNVDPIERMRIEELARIAELHVADVTGVANASSAVVAVAQSEWARQKLDGWHNLFLEVASSLAPSGVATSDEQSSDDEEDDEFISFLRTWSTTIAPALTAMQLGSIVGHLAIRTIGSFDFLLPSEPQTALFVPANMRAFAEDWSLPIEDAELYLVVRELATEAILSRPHVRKRLIELIVRRAHFFRPDPHALESLIAEAGTEDAADPAALMAALGSPTALGQLVDTSELRNTVSELDAVVAALLGYIDWATESVAKRLIGSRLPILEALRRRRLEQREELASAAALFGVATSSESVATGAAFIAGVLERNGEDDLSRLVLVEGDLPTPAEISAPGLWIERIHISTT